MAAPPAAPLPVQSAREPIPEILPPWPEDASPNSPEAAADRSWCSGTEADPPLVHPAPARLVAFGDIHGSITALRRSLITAGATNNAGVWVGGALVVVQTGDLIDRGPDDWLVLRTLERLRKEARDNGGEVHLVMGITSG